MVRWMALDVGEVRIGVALSDTSGFLASPYTTLHVPRNEEQLWIAIQRLIEKTEAEGLVIGLPVSLDGQLHMQGQRVRAFAERLLPHITIPLVFWDERLSTVEAQRLLAQQGEAGKRQKRSGRSSGTRRRRGHEIDAIAATVILQEYLDHLGSKTEEKNT